MLTPPHPNRQDIHIENVLFALSDPTRLAIVAQLDRCDESTCGALDLAVVKATAAQHFRVLREAGITRTRVDGTKRFLSLRREDLEFAAPGLLAAVLGAWLRSSPATREAWRHELGVSRHG